ncbi:MAG: TspO/MBR family protein [Tateyamaria sp.]|jgi:tryptophan-rich sensory protein|uniref:tryptophan-rich sensory protein TspO n=1 Tax=unclassified Tateyamaria TaxID=2645127 RepID=UPI000D55F7A8|nr:TspO/MBR family protein [Tateyamaria sp. Alg231-49]
MDVFLFLIFLATCFGAGATGALFPTGEWYRQLNKPSWTPPNWAFPVMWTSIYVLISFAAARVAGLEGSGYAMAFWAAQIVFNTLWTPMFFGLRRMRDALFVMAALWVSVLCCVITHWQLDVWAGLAMLPYLFWVMIAGALNYSVWQLNSDTPAVDLSKI